MAMIKSWEEARQEGRQEVLLRVLRLRFGGEVDAHVEQRVARASAEQIETWIARLLSAPTLAELLADGSVADGSVVDGSVAPATGE